MVGGGVFSEALEKTGRDCFPYLTDVTFQKLQ